MSANVAVVHEIWSTKKRHRSRVVPDCKAMDGWCAGDFSGDSRRTRAREEEALVSGSSPPPLTSSNKRKRDDRRRRERGEKSGAGGSSTVGAIRFRRTRESRSWREEQREASPRATIRRRRSASARLTSHSRAGTRDLVGSELAALTRLQLRLRRCRRTVPAATAAVVS